MNKNLVLSCFVGLIVAIALFGVKESSGLCTQEMLNDWPDIPCGPIDLPADELREHWQGYYKFKGQEWMESKKKEMEQAILSGRLEQWQSNISNYNVWIYYTITNHTPEVPPLKQFKSGINIDEIKCKEDLILITKSYDGTPACVKPETKQKLIERGWTQDIYNKDQNQSLSENSVELYTKKYDAVIEGKVLWSIGHKVYPLRLQYDIEPIKIHKAHPALRNDNTISFVGERDTATEIGKIAVFGLEYGEKDNYFRLVDRFILDSSNAVIIIPQGSASPESQNYLIPQTLTVVLGVNNTVTWINEDDVASTLVADDGTWQTGMILPGKSSSVTFNQTGIFGYHGEPHPWKKGKVIVLEENEN